MKWRTRFRRLSAAEKHEVIYDIFGGETAYNKFYDAVSVVYRIAEFVFLAAALLFGVVYIAANSDKIQYSQFEYIAQNFAYTLEQNSGQRSYISFPKEGNSRFSLLGGGFAVCGNTNVSIYSAAGVRTAYKRHGLKDPIPIGSGRYLLIYENGGKNYKLYSPYSEMHSDTVEDRIYGACVGADGSYLLITENDDGAGGVLLYDKNFRLINRYTKYGKVITAAISDDGARVAIITVDVGNDGRFNSEVMFCTAGSGEADSNAYIADALPLDCRFGDNGFTVLGDSSAFFFDTDGKLIAESKYGTFDMAAIASDCVLTVTKNSGGRDGYAASLYDAVGTIVWSGAFDGTPLAASVCSGSGFILTENYAVCVAAGRDPIRTDDISEIAAGDRIYAWSADEAYIGTQSHAAVIRFK